MDFRQYDPMQARALRVLCGVSGTPLAVNPMNSQELLSHIDEQVRNYAGDLTQLERAIGALIVGRQFGWKVLLLAHDRKTIAKYGEILKLDFREALPAEGKYAHKSLGWAAAQKVASFWKAVKGEYAEVKSVQIR